MGICKDVLIHRGIGSLSYCMDVVGKRTQYPISCSEQPASWGTRSGGYVVPSITQYTNLCRGATVRRRPP